MRHAFALCLVLAASGASAADIRLDLGPLEARPGKIVRQWVRVINVGSETIGRVFIDCTFYFLGHARTTGGGYTARMTPGAAQTISVGGSNAKADRAECAAVVDAAT